MSKGRDRTVYQRDDGKWINKRNDADKASSVHGTQHAAATSAHKMLSNQGGGELTIKGRDGKIRSTRTQFPRVTTRTHRATLSTEATEGRLSPDVPGVLGLFDHQFNFSHHHQNIHPFRREAKPCPVPLLRRREESPEPGAHISDGGRTHSLRRWNHRGPRHRRAGFRRGITLVGRPGYLV